jgi:hypothetical protein
MGYRRTISGWLSTLFAPAMLWAFAELLSATPETLALAIMASYRDLRSIAAVGRQGNFYAMDSQVAHCPSFTKWWIRSPRQEAKTAMTRRLFRNESNLSD